MGIARGQKLTMTAAKMAANRINAQKALKAAALAKSRVLKGIKTKKLTVMEVAKKKFDVAVAAKVRELMARQMELAYQDQSLSVANTAIDSMLDRAFGRAAQRVESMGGGVKAKIEIVHVYAPDSAPPPPFPDVVVKASEVK